MYRIWGLFPRNPFFHMLCWGLLFLFPLLLLVIILVILLIIILLLPLLCFLPFQSFTSFLPLLLLLLSFFLSQYFFLTLLFVFFSCFWTSLFSNPFLKPPYSISIFLVFLSLFLLFLCLFLVFVVFFCQKKTCFCPSLGLQHNLSFCLCFQNCETLVFSFSSLAFFQVHFSENAILIVASVKFKQQNLMKKRHFQKLGSWLRWTSGSGPILYPKQKAIVVQNLTFTLLTFCPPPPPNKNLLPPVFGKNI